MAPVRHRRHRTDPSAGPTPPQATPGVTASLHAAAAGAGFRLDDSQVAAARALADLAQRVERGERGSQSVYLWGPVGRGKTWLVDAFVSALPPGWARRFHFHTFFRAFHDRLHLHGPGHASVGRAVDDLVAGARVVCFDELYAHEPGDAQLLTLILGELREERDLAMVVTSNYPPDGLLPDATFATSGGGWEAPVEVRHEKFLAGIALIERTFEVVAVDGGVDYRTRIAETPTGGFRAGTYRVMGADTATANAPLVSVSTGHRNLWARRATRRSVTFDFVDLCERATAASDIAILTGRFDEWTIDGVPPLATCSPEAAQRFVNVVDVLCDANVCLHISSPCGPAELVGGHRLPPDVARVRSRLSLLTLVPEGEPPSG